MIALGVAGLLYVLFSASSKPADAPGGGLQRFAIGPLEDLEIGRGPDRDNQSLPTMPVISGANQRTTLEGYRGRVVVLNFWATWCAPCITEMPTLARLQQAFATESVVVVPVSVDRAGDQAFARTRLAELSGGVLPFYGDPGMGTVFEMQARGFPTTIVFDAEGREVARLAGEADWASPQAVDLVAAVARTEPRAPVAGGLSPDSARNPG